MEVLVALLTVVLFLWIVGAICAALIRWSYWIHHRLAVSQVKDFSPTWIIASVDKRALLAFDERRDAIVVVDQKQRSRQLYTHLDIHSVEIVEDGVSITRADRASQIGGALVGAFVAGGVGLLAGAVTGKRTTGNSTDRIDLHIVVDDPRNPVFALCLFKSNLWLKSDEKRNRSASAAAREKARLWQARIALLIRKTSRDVPSAATAEADHSISAEISRLAELNKSGVLTDEEFRLAKRRLLEQLGAPPILDAR